MMNKSENINTLARRGWYDGWFYAVFIDTEKSVFRNKILRHISEQDSILDIGCGTGGLTVNIAKKCKYVLGIDISMQQIDTARKRAKKSKIKNLEFQAVHAGHLTETIERKFDKAVIVFVIHEIAHDDRKTILRELKSYAREIIILDYAEKLPFKFWGLMIRLIEFFAGRAHYQNFRDYMMRGGLTPLLDEAGYRITGSELNRLKVFRIITVVSDDDRTECR